MKRVRGVIGIGASVLSLALAGCGGSSKQPTQTAAVKNVSRTTPAATMTQPQAGKRSTRIPDVIQTNLRVHAIKLHATPGRDQFGRRAVGLAARTATAAAQLMPRVLNMRDLPDGVPDGAISCGRPMPRRHLSGSPFANPFKLLRNATDAERTECDHGAVEVRLAPPQQNDLTVGENQLELRSRRRQVPVGDARAVGAGSYRAGNGDVGE